MFIACLCFTTTSDATPAQACIDNFDEVVVALLNNGADVNSVDSELWTPLHAACTCGNTNIANILVERFVQVCVCVCVCVCALAFVYAFEISILEILNFTKKQIFSFLVPTVHLSLSRQMFASVLQRYCCWCLRWSRFLLCFFCVC